MNTTNNEEWEKTNRAKIRLIMPFQGWCVDGRGFHKHFPILSLIKAIQAKNKYNNQGTKCFCPKCDNELCGSDSYLFFRQSSQGDFEFYKCSKCGTESKWDFDSFPFPYLVN